MSSHFDMRRLGFMGRKIFAERWMQSGMAGLIMIGVLVGISVISLLSGEAADIDYTVTLYMTLLIWGSVEASVAFPHLHKKPENEVELLLPASALEKTLAPLVYVSAALPLFIVLTIFTGSVIGEGLTAVFLPEEGFHPLRLWGVGLWRILLLTLAMQSPFFLGSAWFKKAYWWKTVLFLIALGLGLAVITGFLMWVVFGSASIEGSGTYLRIADIELSVFLGQQWPAVMKGFFIFGKISLILLAPFCWFVAWLRIGETQSSDGI